jgi:hypothetical protein
MYIKHSIYLCWGVTPDPTPISTTPTDLLTAGIKPRQRRYVSVLDHAFVCTQEIGGSSCQEGEARGEPRQQWRTDPRQEHAEIRIHRRRGPHRQEESFLP